MFVKLFIEETKGRSLEDMSREVQAKSLPSRST
ncbi:hypothetical protein [Salinibacter ruber]